MTDNAGQTPNSAATPASAPAGAGAATPASPSSTAQAPSANRIHPERQARVRGALKFFTVAATITGIFLIFLAIRMILEYILDVEIPEWGTYIAMAHGVAYMVYLLSILNLAPKARWSVGKWFTTALAGVVPIFSFVMEFKRRHEVQAAFQL